MLENKYCENCGQKLDEQDKFCISCGVELTTKKNKDSKSKLNKATMVINFLSIVVISVLLYIFSKSYIVMICMWCFEIVRCVLESKGKKIGVGIVEKIEIVLTLVAIVLIYTGYQNVKYIDVVKNQKYMDTKYEDLFDNISNNIEWECVERGRFTVVVPENLEQGGGYEAIVVVSGDYELEGIRNTFEISFNVSKESNAVMVNDLKLGNISYDSDMFEDFLGFAYLSNNVNENNEQEVQSTSNDKWYIEKSTFYNELGDIKVEISCMNDVMLDINFYVGTESMSWVIDAMPKQEKDNGDLVYYDDESFVLTYSPKDDSMYIDTSDGLFEGKYILGDEVNGYAEENNDSAMMYAGAYAGYGGHSIIFNVYSTIVDDEIGVAEIYYNGELVSTQSVYICSDKGDWEEWEYSQLYVMYCDGYNEYLGFYEEDGKIMLDYNGLSHNYDMLELVE